MIINVKVDENLFSAQDVQDVIQEFAQDAMEELAWKLIERLEKLGFEGTDACLLTSLSDYGFIWNRVGHEYSIIYGCSTCDKFGVFDWSTINPNDINSDYDWALEEMSSNELEEFNDLSPMQKINDLVFNHGRENVFGSTYHNFTLKEMVELQEKPA